jgi:acyl carrier protein
VSAQMNVGSDMTDPLAMQCADSMKATVLGAIAESCHLTPTELRLDLPVLDLGLDSLTITSILGELETTWQCEFSQEQIIALFQSEYVGDFLSQVVAFAAPRPVP